MQSQSTNHLEPDAKNLKPTMFSLLWILALFTVVNLCLFIWGIHRGFDIKDEAFMLQCYRFPQIYATTLPSAFQVIVSKIFGSDAGVLNYRIAGFCLKGIATAVFSWGFWSWLKRYGHPG